MSYYYSRIMVSSPGADIKDVHTSAGTGSYIPGHCRQYSAPMIGGNGCIGSLHVVVTVMGTGTSGFDAAVSVNEPLYSSSETIIDTSCIVCCWMTVY